MNDAHDDRLAGGGRSNVEPASTRPAWLNGVAEAVAQRPADQRRPLPELDPAIIRQPEGQRSLVERYCAQAEAVGLVPSVTTSADLASHVAALVRHSGAESVMIEPGLFCRDEVAAELGCEMTVLLPRASHENVYSADIGITGVWSAIAETGSLVCATGRQAWRSVSLIPPLHLAIVRAEQIVPDLLDLFGRLDPAALPAHLTLITGPSKTADIEGILVTGVHGPGQVLVCVVHDTPAS